MEEEEEKEKQTQCHALTLVIFVFFIILVRSGCDEGGMCVFPCLGFFVFLWGFGMSRYM